MDTARIRSAVLSTINDEVEVHEYGHGHLVTLPLAFYDDDLVTLFIEPYEGGIRVSDQGTAAMRLQMSDIDLDNPRVSDAWQRSVASLGAQSIAADENTVGAWGASDELGRLVLAVAEAMMRVDQLRWLSPDRRPVRFRDRVVRQLMDITKSEREVTPNAALPQTSGRTRQVTAAVGSSDGRRVYVQALGASNRDQAAEHCYYVFSHTELPRDCMLAVAAGTPDSWSAAQVDELASVTDVAFFDRKGDVQGKLQARLARLAAHH